MPVVRSLRKLMRYAGFDVRRHYQPVEQPFPVLPLVIDSWMAVGRECFFVQVGANDGVRSDPVRKSILRHSLPGVLIEPVPDLFDELVRNYRDQPQLIFEQAAIGDRDGVLPFYRVRPDARLPDWCNGIGSFDRKHLTGGKFDVPGLRQAVEEISVPTLTFPTLMRKHKIDRVDLLQVDVEGLDDRVVQFALAAGVRPRVINYESVHVPLYRRLELRRQLADLGYRFIDAGKDTTAVFFDDVWRVEE